MSTVSKLTIKACKDNKFSSFTGEFIASINPENLLIKSNIIYHAPISRTTLLRYRHSPPKLLTFSLLLDSTGIIPDSNTLSVMQQIKKLQEVTYNVQKHNNAPNYIRIIWGEIDFKGRLVGLDIVYSMFKMDGTLLRAEANLSILEEIPAIGQGESNMSNATKSTKPSNVEVSKPSSPAKQQFSATPNENGAYSEAPKGAYDGGPDHIYQGDKLN